MIAVLDLESNLLWKTKAHIWQYQLYSCTESSFGRISVIFMKLDLADHD
jgi:hypothetical protein